MTRSTRCCGARAYDLEQPRYAGAPVWPAHEPGVMLSLHRRHERDAAEARTSASALLVMTEHSGTHIDALCHQAYGRAAARRCRGVPARADLDRVHALGLDTVAPIVRRGVLLDVAGAFGRLPRRVTASSWRRPRGIELRPGDVVLVRLGCGRAVGGPRRRSWRAGGMTADASRWLAARARSRSAPTTWRGTSRTSTTRTSARCPGHTILIVQAGIHIIESLFLEELGADGVREFGFICLPLKLRGGTGSPVRPIALV